ncbi:hypothetical protein F5Y15DRAFT_414180 [Xylariaceae sp. FL0016]|nr:hypothetical protein F5Y15DRAFT_414180 [Xylariaceae sp. FL0016]
MAGIAENAQGSLGKAKEQAGEVGQQTAETASIHPREPRSIPDTSESHLEESNNGEGEGEMVPAAGRINEKGEVIDDDGNPIGKVTDGDASQFNGFVVTQEGDILDNDGGVVGKAEPLEDVASELNYTTKSTKGDAEGAAENAQQQGGRFSGIGKTLGGIGSGARSAVGGLTGGAGKGAKGATSAVGDTTKGATDTVGEATGTQDATGAVGDTVKGATDTAGDAADGATGAVDDTAEGAKDTAEGATGAVDDTAEGAKDTAEDATGDAQDAVDGAKSDVQETGEDVPPIDMKDNAGSKTSQFGADLRSKLGSKAGDVAQQAPVDIPELSPSVAGKVVALFEGPFIVSDDGKVMDQNGKILGKLAEGCDIQDLVGKEVHGIDNEGNLMGENDTVLGKVDIAPEGTIVERVKEEVPEAADRLNALEQAQNAAQGGGIQIPAFAPSVADKVIAMFQGPFNIGEDRQIKDQNGKILGKLAEGQELGSLVGKDIKGIDGEGNLLGDNETVLGKVDLVPEGTIAERIKDEVPEAAERLDAIDAAKEQAAEGEEQLEEGMQLPDISILEGLQINKAGNVVDENGNPVGKVKSGEIKKLIGKNIDAKGQVWDGKGNVIGEVEVLPEAIQNESAPFEDFPDATVDKFGKVIFEGRQVGIVEGDDFQKLIGKKVDADGDILDKNGNTIGKAIRQEAEEPEEPEEEPIDYSMLRDKKVNKAGNVVDDKGQVWGHVVQGILKHLVGKKVGENGEIFNDAGKVIGKAEPIPESEREEVKEPSPFEDFPGAMVGDNGAVMHNGEQVGIVVEGDPKKLKGKTVDEDGDILDKAGNQLGRAERWEPEEEPEPEEIDMSILAGKRINKAGNAVDKHGDIYGRVVEGALPRLVGKMCDKQGFIRNEGGDVIGKCELVPESEREGMKEGPFSELTGCTVTKEGKVVTPGGDVVGRLVSGDPKVLAGRPVDDDGDILDKNGNTLGQAERWEEPEVEKEVSPMSGRKVNRQGKVIDENGEIIGKLTQGELGQCAGKTVNDDADVVDPNGNKLGHCTLLVELGDVSPMSGRKVNRDGSVTDENGNQLGKLTSGDLPQCVGKEINDDADVVDAKGNKLGHCSLLTELGDVSPMSGRRVNRDGNVVDENGDLMGKLTSGDVSQCSGKKIDDDGDVVDQKGNRLGHCSLLSEIPEEEPDPEETEEEREARLQLEQDRKIAKQICYCLEQTIDKVKPLCKMMVEKIDAEERKPEDERDEEALVKNVRPLIEEAGKYLTEANGVIRGLDPDGRISAQAQGKSASREATPEEFRLAELLKELTGNITETIDNCKRKLEDMPHAKKQINPLWGLLAEPLFQIVAAVGLLLSGVLGLVGKLLNGLGLGGLVNNLLGGLGINKLVDGLGLGGVLAPITGGKKK